MSSCLTWVYIEDGNTAVVNYQPLGKGGEWPIVLIIVETSDADFTDFFFQSA